MNKPLLAFLAVIAAAAIAFGVMQMGSGDDAPLRAAQLSAELDKAQKELAEKNKQLKNLDALRDELARIACQRDALAKDKEALEKQLKELRASMESNAGIANAPSDPSKNKNPRGGDMRAIARGFLDKLDDPEFRSAMKANQERMITSVYGSLFKKLGLDDQTAKLAADLIGERNIAAMQKGRKLMEGEPSETAMGDVRKDVESVKADYDTKLKSVLGDDKFQEFTSYEQTVGDQRSLDAFSRNFERSGTPLQPDQRDALAGIMREERLKTPSNEIPDIGGGPGMAMLMSDSEAKARQQQEADYESRVLNRAPQAGLSPDQVNVLQDSFKQRSDQRTMGRAMGRLFIGGGGR